MTGLLVNAGQEEAGVGIRATDPTMNTSHRGQMGRLEGLRKAQRLSLYRAQV